MSVIQSRKIDFEIFRNFFSGFFCDKCMNEAGLVPFEPPFCIRCGTRLKTRGITNHLCEECDKKEAVVVGRVRACGMYQGILRESIHLLKYNGKIQLSRPLGIILFSAFRKYFSRDHIDLIIPVPLHRAKLTKRGFNQSFLIVKDFKKFWKIAEGVTPEWRIDYNVLARTKNTKSQTGYDKKKRKDNIKNAFKVTHPNKVKGRHVLLIDDVYTTGATAGAAASVLLNASALSVDVLVIARA